MAPNVVEVKPCRKCAVQIPVEATVCPYCRRSQRSPLKILGLGLVVVLIASYAGIWAVTREDPTVFLRKKWEERFRDKDKNFVRPESKAVVSGKKIRIGMTIQKVRSVIGEPYQINKAVSGDTETEQWVIRKGNGYQYLYFDNGILKTIETK